MRPSWAYDVAIDLPKSAESGDGSPPLLYLNLLYLQDLLWVARTGAKRCFLRGRLGLGYRCEKYFHKLPISNVTSDPTSRPPKGVGFD